MRKVKSHLMMQMIHITPNFIKGQLHFVNFCVRGCRSQKLISEFVYNDATGTADANIFSMFRYCMNIIFVFSF